MTEQNHNGTNSNAFPPPPPPVRPAHSAPRPSAPPVRRSGRWLPALLGVLLVGSILVNVVLLGLLASRLGGPFDLTTLQDGRSNQTIAVYEVSGIIDDRAAEHLWQFVQQVSGDANVKAVVLRVDSPGGTVSASDRMHQALKRLQGTGRTVVVSMGGTAASGAYYLAAPAESIYAEPTTITGSIGVIIQYPILQGTLDKIGVEMKTITSTAAEDWKDLLSPFRQPQEQELTYVRGMLDRMHEQFVQVVADGRSRVLTPARARELADGRIWLGSTARDAGLVDRIGYLEDAWQEASSLAGLSNAKVVRYQRRARLLEQFRAQGPGVHLDAQLLDNLQTPRMLMLWKVQS